MIAELALGGVSKRGLAGLKLADLQDRVDTLRDERNKTTPTEPATTVGLPATTPEPASDMAAQVRAMLDPASAKDSVFVARGTATPDIPKDAGNVLRVPRAEGTLLTTDPAKAQSFRKGPVNDAKLAGILDYPQDKPTAMASGDPAVVQATDAAGHVVSNALASPDRVAETADALAAHVPDGRVAITTAVDAQAERAAKVAAEDTTARTATPLAKHDVAGAVDRMMTELAAGTGAEANTPQRVRQSFGKMVRELAGAGKPTEVASRVHAAVADWGTRNDSPVTAKVLRLLTGEGGKGATETVAERAARREEFVHAAGEDARESSPSKYEKDGVASKVDLEDAHASAQDAAREDLVVKEADTSVAAPVTKPVVRAPGEELSRFAAKLHEAVLAGDMTVHEAQDAYGRKAAGTKGRDRAFPTYGHYLDERIAHAESPAVAARLKALLESKPKPKEGEDGIAYMKRAEVKTKAENKLMAETGSTHAAELRALKVELDDPVGHEVRRAAQDGFEPHYDALLRASSRFVQTVGDERVNAPLAAAMHAAEARADRGGKGFTLHDGLRAILNDPAIARQAPVVEAMARKLLALAPDLPTMTPERALRDGHATPSDAAGPYEGALMRDANGTPTHILLRTGEVGAHTQPIETLLHEGVHAAASRYIDRIGSQPNHPDALALRAIGRELARQFPDESAARSMGLDPRAVGDAGKSLHELHAMLLSNPTIQRLAASRRASPQLLADLKAAGVKLREPGRSPWRYVMDWTRRALGMSETASASGHTLLDHIMRPAQDVTDRAGAYNRAVADPVVRGMGEPLLRSIGSVGGDLSGRAKEAKRELITRLVGARDFTRDAARQWTTDDNLVAGNRATFEPSSFLAMTHNPLLAARAAREGIGYASRSFVERHNTEAEPLIAELKSADGALPGNLLVDATLANVKLGSNDPNANAHLTKPEQQADQAKLEQRYRALTADQRATYDGSRDLLARMYHETRQAQLGDLAKRVLPHATPEQVKRLQGVLGTHDGIERFMAESDRNPLAKSFGEEWAKGARGLVRTMAKIHDAGHVKGDYFPLKRFGDYVLHYGSDDAGNYAVERFERRGDADARYAELKAANMDDLHQVELARGSTLKDVAPQHPMVEELVHAMNQNEDLRGHREEVRDLLNGVLMEHATRAEQARAALRRKGVAGASQDAGRVLAQEVLTSGVRVGYHEHGGDLSREVSNMHLVARDLADHGRAGDQIRALSVIREFEKRIASVDDAHGILSDTMRRATSLGYAKSLASLSHLLTSTGDAHTNSMSILGARHGVVKTGVAVARALSHLTPKMAGKGATIFLKAFGKGVKDADWNLVTAAREALINRGANRTEMTDLFRRFELTGMAHTMNREMQRVAGNMGTSLPGQMWQRFMDLNAASAHAVDMANRGAILKAGYDLERAKGFDHAHAADYAIEKLRQIVPNYTGKARIATPKGSLKAFGAPLGQFKNYGLHMYGMMANLTKESLHGATKEAQREARYALAGVLATHAIMAGSITLIADPLRYIGGAYDWATGATKPHAYENDVRGWMSDTFGKEVGQLLARGLPNYLGIDLHQRIGLGNLLEIPGLESFDAKGISKMLVAATTGAAGEDAAMMVGGLGKIVRGLEGGDAGAVFNGVKELAPRAISDVMKANVMATQGVVDGKGKTILPASKISGFDVAARAIGFQPSSVSEFREGRAAVQEAQDEAKTSRQQLAAAWLAAKPIDRAAVMSQIRVFNMANPGMTITVGGLMRMQQGAAADVKKPSNFGLHLNAKVAATIAARGRFANVSP